MTLLLDTHAALWFWWADPQLSTTAEALIRDAANRKLVSPATAWEVAALPFHHKDPFDRLLIAQAMWENIPIVSADLMFDAYPIKRLW